MSLWTYITGSENIMILNGRDKTIYHLSVPELYYHESIMIEPYSLRSRGHKTVTPYAQTRTH